MALITSDVRVDLMRHLWTVLRHDGPDHLGLWFIRLPADTMALITPGSCQSGAEGNHDRPAVRDGAGHGLQLQSL